MLALPLSHHVIEARINKIVVVCSPPLAVIISSCGRKHPGSISVWRFWVSSVLKDGGGFEVTQRSLTLSSHLRADGGVAEFFAVHKTFVLLNKDGTLNN